MKYEYTKNETKRKQEEKGAMVCKWGQKPF